MTDGVDTPPYPVQASAFEPMLDCSLAKTERNELRSGYDAVLTCCELPDSAVGRRTTTFSPYSGHNCITVGHGQ